MTFKLDAKIDTTALLLRMQVQQEQWPIVVAHALNVTTEQAKATITETMRGVFDRPTPFTQNALKIAQARPDKSQPYAEIRIRDDGVGLGKHYLNPQVYGGARAQKRGEYALGGGGVFYVPGKDVQRDAYGNIPRGLMAKILSQTRRATDRYANESAVSKTRREKREIKKRGFASNFFLVKPGQGGATAHLSPGVWERVKFSSGSALRPVLVQSRGAPGYKPRLLVFDITGKVMERRYEANLRLAIDRYLKGL